MRDSGSSRIVCSRVSPIQGAKPQTLFIIGRYLSFYEAHGMVSINNNNFAYILQEEALTASMGKNGFHNNSLIIL